MKSMQYYNIKLDKTQRKEVLKLRNWLKKLRNEKKLTQQDVANKMEMSLSNYNLIESGERQKDLDLSLVVKLADILDVSVNYIIEEEEKLKER